MFENVPNCTRALSEGAHLAQWRYKESDRLRMPQDLQPMSESDEWQEGANNAKAQNWARWLMETPANLMTPTIFCHRVTEMLEPLGSGLKNYPDKK